jgi:hypothetical protein
MRPEKFYQGMETTKLIQIYQKSIKKIRKDPKISGIFQNCKSPETFSRISDVFGTFEFMTNTMTKILLFFLG